MKRELAVSLRAEGTGPSRFAWPHAADVAGRLSLTLWHVSASREIHLHIDKCQKKRGRGAPGLDHVHVCVGRGCDGRFGGGPKLRKLGYKWST